MFGAFRFRLTKVIDDLIPWELGFDRPLGRLKAALSAGKLIERVAYASQIGPRTATCKHGSDDLVGHVKAR